jgi:hypothetical protein
MPVDIPDVSIVSTLLPMGALYAPELPLPADAAATDPISHGNMPFPVSSTIDTYFPAGSEPLYVISNCFVTFVITDALMNSFVVPSFAICPLVRCAIP